MQSTSWKLVRFSLPIALVPLFACMRPPVEAPATTITQETNIIVDIQAKDKVDILFMVDDSLSMAPKQQALRQRIPALIQVLDQFAKKGNPAWYHIGVVTSSLGSGPDKCPNDGGKLWGRAKNPAAGTANGTDCRSFMVTGNKNFIDYNQKMPISMTNPNTNGVPLADAFNCISDVGDQQGCGFEHQLESVYRALNPKEAPKENQGFLRKDALLAVVWVTDEDDCSAPTDSDLFGMDMSKYGLRHSFRCTQFGIQCDGMFPLPNTDTDYKSCQSAPAGMNKLFDVQRYIDFFKKDASQGGLKAFPDDIILAGIVAPPTPFGQATFKCDINNPPNCLQLKHSCNVSAEFFGDPAVRLTTVINAVNNHAAPKSICDSDFSDALTAIGQLITSKIQPGCLNAPVINRPDNSPDCIVEDVKLNDDGTVEAKEIPWCQDNMSSNGAFTCWRFNDHLKEYDSQGCANKSPSCTLPASCQPVTDIVSGQRQLYGITVDRDAQGTPTDTHLQVGCATVSSKGM